MDYATVAIGLSAAAAGMSESLILMIPDRYAERRSSFGDVPMDPVWTHLPKRNVRNTLLGYELYRDGKLQEGPK